MTYYYIIKKPKASKRDAAFNSRGGHLNGREFQRSLSFITPLLPIEMRRRATVAAYHNKLTYVYIPTIATIINL